MQFRTAPIPDVVKNLLIINALMYVASLFFHPYMSDYLAMYPVSSSNFQPYQIITHMFMHDTMSIWHIAFNMFALWMFGREVEYAMGAKKFLLFYLVTGLGAAFLHQVAGYIELQYVAQGLDMSMLDRLNETGKYPSTLDTATENQLIYAYRVMNIPAVGASGAIYGVLAAFGLLYPNRMIMLLIPPIPMKAKYFVIVMGAFALFAGFTGTQAGVAHFAHLGGAIFGYIMILIWRRRGETF